jgi:cellulose synthase/poly-beta-1,6-N-acetylglucosamine synthase-like glycosyltransferase
MSMFAPFSWPSYLVLAVVLFGISTAVFWAAGVGLWMRRGYRDRPREQISPFVSAIVAGRNEESWIGGCLSAILAQNYPADRFEITFVDDHSTDHTVEYATNISQTSLGRVRVISAPPCPPAVGPKKNALMAGIAASKGDLLIFTDADCLVPPNWVHAHVSCYDEQTGAVTGPVLKPQRNELAYRLAFWERALIGMTSAAAIGWGKPASASGANFSYRRSIYDDLGGLAHAANVSGDDDLMAQEIARRGWKVAFASGADAVVIETRFASFRQQIHSAVRHQATLPHYPFFWRAIYAASIVAAVIQAPLFVLGLWFPEWRILCWGGITARFLFDAWGARRFAQALDVRIGIFSFLLCELVLPLYLAGRALVSFFPSFSWHGRTLRKLSPEVSR